MTILITALILGIIPAFVAHSKGKSFILWWIYGVAIFIIALPHSLLIKSNNKKLEYRQLIQGMKKCLHCAELIKQEAHICRFCGRDFIRNNVQHQLTSSSTHSIQPSTTVAPNNIRQSINDYYRELGNR